jgi:hypothetical protein
LHLQRFLQYLKFSPSTIFLYPSPPPFPRIVSTDFIFPFQYMCTEYIHYICPPTPQMYYLIFVEKKHPQCKLWTGLCSIWRPWQVIFFLLFPFSIDCLHSFANGSSLCIFKAKRVKPNLSLNSASLITLPSFSLLLWPEAA